MRKRARPLSPPCPCFPGQRAAAGPGQPRAAPPRGRGRAARDGSVAARRCGNTTLGAAHPMPLQVRPAQRRGGAPSRRNWSGHVGLEQIRRGDRVEGLSPSGLVEVVGVGWLGEQQVEVVFRSPKGPDQRILMERFRLRESRRPAPSPGHPPTACMGWSSGGAGRCRSLVRRKRCSRCRVPMPELDRQDGARCRIPRDIRVEPCGGFGQAIADVLADDARTHGFTKTRFERNGAGTIGRARQARQRQWRASF